jgi:branched-subunit amino acid aminotransferase/4-amino-4-deoxychorismate lyase
MLEEGRVAERVVTVEELRSSPRVLLVNSVRGMVEVKVAPVPTAAPIGPARGR